MNGERQRRSSRGRPRGRGRGRGRGRDGAIDRARDSVSSIGDDHVTHEQVVAPQPPTTNQGTVDLNSKSATHVADIVFRRPQQYNFPIYQFECHDCLETCQYIRSWLQSVGPQNIRPLVRLEDQMLDKVNPGTKGTLLFLDDAATLDGNPAAPISVFTLYIPQDKHIRYFWTLLSPAPLLPDLTIRALLGPPVEIPYFDNPPRHSGTGAVLPSRHHSLYTFLTQSFHAATTFPDSPAYRTASQISDVCPSILDPDTAYRRIEAEDELHTSRDASADGRDLGDDRYLLELEPAERALASLVDTCCADYLLLKRQYFKVFSRETVIHAEKVRRAVAHHQNVQHQMTPAGEDGNEDESPHSTPHTTMHDRASARGHRGALNRALRVRTRHAHVRAVEAQTGWGFTRSKKLIIGWEILGFLDEQRVLAVFDGGDDGDDDIVVVSDEE